MIKNSAMILMVNKMKGKNNEMFFTDYVTCASLWRGVYKSMNFWERINPIYIYKHKVIEKQLEEDAKMIYDITLDKILLKNFQEAFLLNEEYWRYDKIVIHYINGKDMYFYDMTLSSDDDTIRISIILDSITIKYDSKNEHLTFKTENVIEEDNHNYKIIKILKDRIYDYLIYCMKNNKK